MRNGRNEHSGIAAMDVVVIVAVLCILAVFAVPRFAALEMESRTVATEALAGSVRARAALAHALWLAQDRPRIVTVRGREITMANGYPDRATIDDALSELSEFSYDARSGVFQRTDTTGDCKVVYAEARSAGTPTVAAATGGC